MLVAMVITGTVFYLLVLFGVILWKLIDQSRFPRGSRAFYRNQFCPELWQPLDRTSFDPDQW